MAYKADGTWSVEDDSVANKVAEISSADSPLMRTAAATGIRQTNRRGLANSSMGIGAGVAATLAAATPIASQDAQQVHSKNIQLSDQQNQRMLTAAQIASQDRSNYTSALTQIGSNASQGIANTLQNAKIPAAARNAAQSSISNLYASQQQQIAALYNVNLQWGAGG